MIRFIIKAAILLGVVALLFFNSESQRPLAHGKVISVTMWAKPPGQLGENSFFTPPAGSRIEVYENLIIVTTPEGISHVSSNDLYTNLMFKPD